ncbi:hypothetical protein [Metabacillus iocasae]|uniref:Uncharacterized protein n=1 Tax=Priestia iocasae TaxID=2291674 RepID=A0ABS2QU78_9BACI|nr:hypothetical protein [Metabacillus iocasae]MBM7702477.1 hypothetical protein [Metabacillus iocasae]
MSEAMVQTNVIYAVERHFDWGLKEGKELFSNLPSEIIEQALETLQHQTQHEQTDIKSAIRILNFVKYKQISFASVLFSTTSAQTKLHILQSIDAALDTFNL